MTGHSWDLLPLWHSDPNLSFPHTPLGGCHMSPHPHIVMPLASNIYKETVIFCTQGL